MALYWFPSMLDKQQTWAWPVASGQHLIVKKFLLEHWTLVVRTRLPLQASLPGRSPRCLTRRLTHGHWTRPTPKLHSSSSRQSSPAHRSSRPLFAALRGSQKWGARRAWDGSSCVCPAPPSGLPVRPPPSSMSSTNSGPARLPPSR